MGLLDRFRNKAKDFYSAEFFKPNETNRPFLLDGREISKQDAINLSSYNYNQDPRWLTKADLANPENKFELNNMD